MNSLIVDTDVVSYVFRNHSAAALYIPIIENHKLWISFMTRAEIRLGAGKANWGPRTLALLDRYLSNYEIRFPDETDVRPLGGDHSGRHAPRASH